MCYTHLFALTKDKIWRMYVGNRRINQITVKYWFSIPIFQDLLDQLVGAYIFLKINLCCGYHHIKTRPNDKWKTTLKKNEGLYEWFVMLLWLSNVLSTFTFLLNRVLKPFSCKFFVVYFDNILIYSIIYDTPRAFKNGYGGFEEE